MKALPWSLIVEQKQRQLTAISGTLSSPLQSTAQTETALARFFVLLHTAATIADS